MYFLLLASSQDQVHWNETCAGDSALGWEGLMLCIWFSDLLSLFKNLNILKKGFTFIFWARSTTMASVLLLTHDNLFVFLLSV